MGSHTHITPTTKTDVLNFFRALQDLWAPNKKDITFFWKHIHLFGHNPHQLVFALEQLSKVSKNIHLPRTIEFQSWEELIWPAIPSLSAKQVASIIASFARLKRIPSDKMVDILKIQAITQFSQFKPRDISRMLSGFARLAIIPKPRLMQLVRSFAQDHSGLFIASDKIDFLRALAILDSLEPRAENHQLARDFHSSVIEVEDEIRSKGILYDVRNWFGFQQSFEHPPESASFSRFERDLYEAFRENGFDIAHGFTSPQFPRHTFDYLLRYDGAAFIVELDGIFHYNTDAYGMRTLDGGTYFQSALIEEALLYDPLIRVPSETGEFIIHHITHSAASRKSFIFDFLLASAQNPGRFVAPTINEDASITGAKLFNDHQFKTRKQVRALRVG